MVDSSVWIEYINKKVSVSADALEKMLKNGIANNIAIADVTLTEVLQGTREEKEYHQAKQLLLQCRIFTSNSISTYIHATDIFRTCKQKGVTVRSTIDTIIAAIAISNKTPLFSIDKDFNQIARVCPLQLY